VVGDNGKYALSQTQEQAVILSPQESIWHDRDFHIFDEVPDGERPFWQRIPMWVVIAALIGVVIGMVFWYGSRDNDYHSILLANSTWIQQESVKQQACMNNASTNEALIACASNAYQAITAHKQDFAAQNIPSHLDNASAQIVNAYAALTAATCYDPTIQGIDVSCRLTSAINLNIAQLDARDAVR
jgi:hypothetical protein